MPFERPFERQAYHAPQVAESERLGQRWIGLEFLRNSVLAVAGGENKWNLAFTKDVSYGQLGEGKLIAIRIDNAVMNATRISLITRAGRQLPSGVYRLMLRVEAHLENLIACGG